MVLLVNDTRGSRVVQVVGSRRTLLLVVGMMRLNLQICSALELQNVWMKNERRSQEAPFTRLFFLFDS